MKATTETTKAVTKRAASQKRVTKMVDDAIAAGDKALKAAARKQTKKDDQEALKADMAGKAAAFKRAMSGKTDEGAELANDPAFLANLDKERAARQAVITGKPAEQPKEAPAIPSTGYTGPMLALRSRLKQGLYGKAANGQPSCGDELATILGTLEPTEVIRACMIALDLSANPYLHLNIGQQSMNLRNKLRGALKKGTFGMGVVREAVEQVADERPNKIKLSSATDVDAIEIKV